MISYKTGDLFNDESEAIVNTVNCVGVMGRGIALQFKKHYPSNFKEYALKCKLGQINPGKVFVYEQNGFLNPKFIINFPTKNHWRENSRIEYIESGLLDLVGVINRYKITSIAIPPLGCGLGGLDWNVVKNTMETILSPLDSVNISIYIPAGAPKAKDMTPNKKIPNMTAGRAALVELINCYLNGLLEPFITLLEIHKLMYFLQVSGETLRLSYVKDKYGPFATNLSHVLNAIEGYMLSGYADGGNNPQKHLELLPGAIIEAKNFLSLKQDTIERIKRVSDLVDGFETPFGLELLATVHWIVENGADTLDEVITETYSWNERKKQFSERQIIIALKRLYEQKWISNIYN